MKKLKLSSSIQHQDRKKSNLILHLGIKIAMGIYLNKDTFVFIDTFVDRAQIASNVDTATVEIFPLESVIV